MVLIRSFAFHCDVIFRFVLSSKNNQSLKICDSNCLFKISFNYRTNVLEALTARCLEICDKAQYLSEKYTTSHSKHILLLAGCAFAKPKTD